MAFDRLHRLSACTQLAAERLDHATALHSTGWDPAAPELAGDIHMVPSIQVFLELSPGCLTNGIGMLFQIVAARQTGNDDNRAVMDTGVMRSQDECIVGA